MTASSCGVDKDIFKSSASFPDILSLLSLPLFLSPLTSFSTRGKFEIEKAFEFFWILSFFEFLSFWVFHPTQAVSQKKYLSNDDEEDDEKVEILCEKSFDGVTS